MVIIKIVYRRGRRGVDDVESGVWGANIQDKTLGVSTGVTGGEGVPFGARVMSGMSAALGSFMLIVLLLGS